MWRKGVVVVVVPFDTQKSRTQYHLRQLLPRRQLHQYFERILNRANMKIASSILRDMPFRHRTARVKIDIFKTTYKLPNFAACMGCTNTTNIYITWSLLWDFFLKICRFVVYIYSRVSNNTQVCSYPLEYFAMSHRRVPSCVFLRVSFGFFGSPQRSFSLEKKSSFAPFGNTQVFIRFTFETRQDSNLDHNSGALPTRPMGVETCPRIDPLCLHLVFHYFSQLNSNSKPSLLMNQKWRSKGKNHWLPQDFNWNSFQHSFFQVH